MEMKKMNDIFFSSGGEASTPKINVDFKKTCKILFGQEIGELGEFAPYLSESNWPYVMGESCVSGKQVMLSGPHYGKSARFASQDEIPSLKFAPVSINDIKDIDTLFAAASERAVYCGNKVFGRNLGVEGADNIVDGIEVHQSHDVYQSKYMAYCSVGRYAESSYGVNNFQMARNSMRCHICFLKGAQRCFETYLTTGISDSYYTFNCTGSSLMFCFNLKNRSNCIGNLQLTRERYATLKQKLVSEMAEKLKKDKRLFSLASLFAGEETGIRGRRAITPECEKSLATAIKIVLQKEHAKPARYAIWLERRAVKVWKADGANGEQVLKYETPTLKGIAPGKLCSLPKALQSAGKCMSLGEGEMPALEEVAARAAKGALLTLEFDEGQNQSVSETPVKYDSANNCALWFSLHSKHSGISSIVTDSDYCFGGYIRTLECQFCVSCNNITKCSGCFECDSCFSCRNCFFCHNCENVEEGILCFNLKGARYAILNQTVSKEEYMRVKGMLLSYLNRELEEKGALERSIFSLAAHSETKNGGKPPVAVQLAPAV